MAENETEHLRSIQTRAEALADREQDRASKAETAVGLGVFVLMLGGAAAAIVASIREDKRRIEAERFRVSETKRLKEEFDNWVNEEENNGNRVYKLVDGRYLTVDRDAKQMTHVKKLKP